MSTSPQKRDATTPPSSTVVLLMGDFVGVMVRMFVPILVTTGAGYGIDQLANSRPIGVFTGLVAGIIVSIVLVIMQYKKVTK